MKRTRHDAAAGGGRGGEPPRMEVAESYENDERMAEFIAVFARLPEDFKKSTHSIMSLFKYMKKKFDKLHGIMAEKKKKFVEFEHKIRSMLDHKKRRLAQISEGRDCEDQAIQNDENILDVPDFFNADEIMKDLSEGFDAFIAGVPQEFRSPTTVLVELMDKQIYESLCSLMA